VLTIGMAVDANVLIYERIREEIRAGKTAISAIEAGFSRAFVTIVDSQLTTLAAALLMFGLGSGPVRGFAVTLSIGIFTSVFTAVTVTRLLVWWWLGQQKGRANRIAVPI
jgi:preprotein translocase subunit SecD